jgi:hypothetical protein
MIIGSGQDGVWTLPGSAARDHRKNEDRQPEAAEDETCDSQAPARLSGTGDLVPMILNPRG